MVKGPADRAYYLESFETVGDYRAWQAEDEHAEQLGKMDAWHQHALADKTCGKSSSRWAGGRELAESTATRLRATTARFPVIDWSQSRARTGHCESMSWSGCRDFFGGDCEFMPVCHREHGWEDPLGTGSYRLRWPNHEQDRQRHVAQ